MKDLPLPDCEDKLDAEYIDHLPKPFICCLWANDNEYPVEGIETINGFIHVRVMGKLKVKHISDIKYFKDVNGKRHDPDDFYCQ